MIREKHPKPEPIAANLTPMIDVVFLLIVFFVLVSQIVEVENADLDLPRPQDPASVGPGEQARIVINVLPGSGGDVSGYRVGTRRYVARTAGLPAPAAGRAPEVRPKTAAGGDPPRARPTRHQGVEPVFEAVSAAARLSGREDVHGRVNLVVVREP